jgi:predicted amidohydrolase YtcJ
MPPSPVRPEATRPGRWPIATAAAILAAAALLVVACAPERPPADLVLTGGTVATMDSTRPRAEGIAVRGDSIVAVGDAGDIEAWIGPDTRVIDLEGRFAMPGFVESHGHFMGLGQARMQLDLMGASSWSEIVAMVDSAADAAEPGTWILGRGWHQEKWDRDPSPSMEGFPVHDDLSRVAPEHPVLLTHASGHASIVNARAMELAGIGPDTESPEGGEIIRDYCGRATGVLVDAAERLAHEAREEALSELSEDARQRRRREQAELAAAEAVAHGVTSFHDQGASFGTLELYRSLAAEGALPLRLFAMVAQEEVTPGNAARLDAIRDTSLADDRLAIRSIGEVSADGALGSRSAWMLEPYEDLEGSTGLNVTDMERVREIADLALDHGYQLAVHAIGDRANRETLDLFAGVFDSAGVDGDSLRWRIEHAQHLHPDDVPRFGELGVIASMQAMHACSDAPYVVERLGTERARQGAYLWRSLRESGAVVTNGTDVPVEAIDPLASYHCTVTRAYGEGERFFPDEALGREAALRTYTTAGAYAGYAEEATGSLSPGKLADIVVLSRDLLTVPDDAIRGARVLFTIVGGEVVHEAGSGDGG